MQTYNRTKTVIALVMAVFMLATFTGCADLAQLISPTPTPSPTPTATPTPSPTPTPTPAPTPEPNVDSFSLGVGDDTGYLSKYFDLGFRLPDGWKAYNRSYIDLLNMIKADGSNAEAYLKEYQTLLKNGQTIYDYVGYNKSANEMILVLLKDNSDNGTGVLSEQEAVDAYAASICDIGSDGTIDALNIRKDTIKLGDTEHPMTRFELPMDAAYGYCALFAVQKDSTFAYVNLMCPSEQMLQDVIDSLYQYSDYPSIESYSMPQIGEKGFDSAFLGLKFDSPAGWEYYNRETLDEFNKVTVSETGEDARNKAYRDFLKDGNLDLEYCGYEKDIQHMVFIYTANSTGNWMDSVSGRDFFDTLLPWLFDFDKDGKVDVLNGSFSRETVLGQDCYVYRFDDRKGTTGVIGMLFTYRRGSTFVGIDIVSVVPGAIEQILPLINTNAQ